MKGHRICQKIIQYLNDARIIHPHHQRFFIGLIAQPLLAKSGPRYLCPAFQQGRDILWFWGLTSKLGIHTASLADIGDKPIKSVNIC